MPRWLYFVVPYEHSAMSGMWVGACGDMWGPCFELITISALMELFGGGLGSPPYERHVCGDMWGHVGTMF